jgi:hypothetical protein
MLALVATQRILFNPATLFFLRYLTVSVRSELLTYTERVHNLKIK